MTARPVGVGRSGGAGGRPIYTIQPGDTTTTVARRLRVAVPDLLQANPQKLRAWTRGPGLTFGRLTVGERIWLPASYRPGYLADVGVGRVGVGADDGSGIPLLCQDGTNPDSTGTCDDGSVPSTSAYTPAPVAQNTCPPGQEAELDANGNQTGCSPLYSGETSCIAPMVTVGYDGNNNPICGMPSGSTSGGSSGGGGGGGTTQANPIAACQAAGNTWDTSLNMCVIPAPPPPAPTCPAGQTLQANGTCSASVTQCPAGQALQPTGGCAPYVAPCLTGQVRLPSGQCGTPIVPPPAKTATTTTSYVGPVLGVLGLAAVGIAIAAASEKSKTKKTAHHEGHERR
jgi:hypothetical protein